MPLDIIKKMVCPENKEHKEFVTTAHEMHKWVVDEKGNFIEDLGCLETTKEPDTDNIWRCKQCGAEAVIEEE